MRLSLTSLSLFALSVGVVHAQSVGTNLTQSKDAPTTASPSRATNPRIWFTVSKNRITIAGTENEMQRMRSSPEDIGITCRDLKFEGSSEDGRLVTRLVCAEASFVAGRGLSGSAARMVFDSAAQTLELRSSDKQQVKLTYKSDSVEMSQLVASEVRISMGNSRFEILGANDAFRCDLVFPKNLKPVSYQTESPYGSAGIGPPINVPAPVYVPSARPVSQPKQHKDLPPAPVLGNTEPLPGDE